MANKKQMDNQALTQKQTTPPLLEMRHISKYFAGVRANHNINLQICQGEVHALLGENGAGKSTLMNILYGLYPPTAGKIYWKGQAVDIQSPKDAIALGIGMVHQHFMLIPALSVVENVVLGMNCGRQGRLNLNEAAKKIEALAKAYNMSLDPWAKVWQLSVGQQQRLEILKALYKGADLLILDEPTAVLTPQETEELFNMIRRLTEANHTVIFISHKLNEIMAICDRVSILRLGEITSTIHVCDTCQQTLARLMMGGEELSAIEKKPASLHETVLECTKLCCRNTRGLMALKDLSLSLAGGEILGIAGVDGNGQSELADAICGLLTPESGKVRINGVDMAGKSARAFLEQGVGHIPEDRHRRGVVLSMNIRENFILMNYYKAPMSHKHLLDWKLIDRLTDEAMASYQVKAPDRDALMQNLSGGNQQKIVLARELSKAPSLLIAMHPSRGLDFGATAYVHNRIIEARDRGCAVLLISTEIEEILALSDRVAVLYEGEVVGQMPAAEVKTDTLGLMMAGALRGAG